MRSAPSSPSSGTETVRRRHRTATPMATPSRRRRATRSPGLGGVTRSDIWRELGLLGKKIDVLQEQIQQMGELLKVKESPHSKIPLELSALVRQTHRGMGDLQWRIGPNEKFRTPYNESVTSSLMQALCDLGQGWNPQLMRKACNRAYENLKAQSRMESGGSKEVILRRKLITSRRDRLFKKRVKVAKDILCPEDYLFLKGADPCLMSDEESDEEKTLYRFSSPVWRAPRLSDIIVSCQQELDKNRRKGVDPRSTHHRIPSGQGSTRSAPASRKGECYVQEEEEEEV